MRPASAPERLTGPTCHAISVAPTSTQLPDPTAALAGAGIDVILDSTVGLLASQVDSRRVDAWFTAARSRVHAACDPTSERTAVLVDAPESGPRIAARAASLALQAAGWDVHHVAAGTSIRAAAMQVPANLGVLVIAADTPAGAFAGEDVAVSVVQRTPVVTVGAGYTLIESERLLPGASSFTELAWEMERALLFWDGV